MRKKRLIAFFTALITVIVLLSQNVSAFAKVEYTNKDFADKNTIYVVGNPDLYPFEFFDNTSSEINGIMPAVLEFISNSTGYNFTYLSVKSRDDREMLIKNKQVQIVSGITDREKDETGNKILEEYSKDSVAVFSLSIDDEDYTVYFSFSEIASQKLIYDIKNCIETNKDTLNQIAIGEIIENNQEEQTQLWLIIVVDAIACILLGFIVFLSIKYSKYKKRYNRTLLEDQQLHIDNRKAFIEKFNNIIVDDLRDSYYIFYFAFDITHINRYYSEGESDEILRHCATILHDNITSDSDFFARISGGGFAVAKMTTKDEAIEWGNKVISQLRDYKIKFDKGLNPAFNCGIYRLTVNDTDADNAIDYALRGYLDAAERDCFCTLVSDKLIKDYLRETELKNDTEDAIKNNFFRIYLQPIHAAKDYELVGYEMLSRWQHPKFGLMTPASYITLLEKTGTVFDHDMYMFEQSCMLLERWENLYGNDFSISCNFSRVTIHRMEFIEKIKEISEKYEFDHSKLVAEITESINEKNRYIVFENMLKLEEMGFKLALDDMGSGYTSFSDLKDYPIDIVKIDKSILDNSDNENGAALLEGIIALCHILKKSVLCEGVETEENVKMLENYDCDRMQGFYFSRPIPLEEIEKNLNKE